MSERPSRPRDVRIAWMFAGTLALAGYALVLAPSERRLDAIDGQAHELYDSQTVTRRCTSSGMRFRKFAPAWNVT